MTVLDLHDDHHLRELGRESVVEEKSSRVMEVILNAATPFQLLTGKVLGVGAVALLTQYAAVLVAGAIALLAQASVAAAALGTGSADVSLPAGLTFGMLAMLFVYGVLGFLAVCRAVRRRGSLVSRQEDVNTVVMPLTLISPSAISSPSTPGPACSTSIPLDAGTLTDAVREPVHDAEPHHEPGASSRGRSSSRSPSSSHRSWPRCGSPRGSTRSACCSTGSAQRRGDLAAGPVRHVTRPTREPATDASGIRAG